MTAAFVMPEPNPAQQPVWLRPAALAVAVALHAGALFYGAMRQAEIPAAVDTIDISIEPAMGETTDENVPDAPDTMAQQAVEAPNVPTPPDDVKPPEDQAMDDTPPPPTPEQTVSAEAPKVEDETAPVIPQKPPEEIKKPIEKPTPVVKKRPPPPQAAVQQSAHRARAGQENGRRATASARAAFAGRLLAAIRRNTHGIGVAGSTGVAFVVGPWGGMSSVWVARSSGNGALDSAAVRAVRAAHVGSPPGGSFPGHTTINFAVHY